MNELTKSVAKRTTCSNAVTKLLMCVSLILVGAFSATVLADRHSSVIPHELELAVLDGDTGVGGSTAGNSKSAFAGKCLWQMVADIHDTLASTASAVMAGLIDSATNIVSWTKGVFTKAIEGFVALAATSCATPQNPHHNSPIYLDIQLPAKALPRVL